jgi:hypothetical protein
MVRRLVLIGAVLALGGCLPTPVAAADVLHDQTTGTAGGSGTQSFDYMSAQPSQTADDFTVPSGQAWTITQLDVSGFGVVGSRSLNVFIYADVGIPGAELFRSTNVSAAGGPNFTIPVSGAPSLPPGTYWISAQVNLMSPDQWFWQDRAPVEGHAAVFRDASCPNWQPRDNCEADPGWPDQAFRLIGTASPYPPPPSNAFSFGKLTRNTKTGTATLIVSVPGPGKLALSGNGVVKQRPAGGDTRGAKGVAKVVSAAGKVKLKVRSKGKKKRKLNRTGRLKLKAKVTYTPTGGDPNTKAKRIRLIKRLR